jgi:hypothetical protein
MGLKQCIDSPYSPWAPHTYDFVAVTYLTYPRKVLLVVLKIWNRKSQSISWEANSFSVTQEIPSIFMESEGSLPCSQHPATGLYSDIHESNPYPLPSRVEGCAWLIDGILDWTIGFIDTLYAPLETTGNYSAIADLYTLLHIVTHALVFSIISHILATDL